MSDAQGDKREPVDIDPVEETPDGVENTPEAEEPAAQHSALRDAIGEDDEPITETTPEDGDRAEQRSGDAPADAPEPDSDEAADEPAGDDKTVDADGDGVPDYAALAAELDELERNGVTPAAGAERTERPLSPAKAAEDASDPWFEPAPTKAFSADDGGDEAPAIVPAPGVPTVAVGSVIDAQPIFVQAPEVPRKRGNRGAAGLIGLVAALVFAVVFFAANLAWHLLAGDFGVDGIVDASIAGLTSASFWVTVAVFWVGYWILGALLNRARWGVWVVFGLVVGAIAYVGYLLGLLFQAPFWMITADEASTLLTQNLLSPMAIVAFILGREITIWFSAWSAKRGRRITELNAEDRAEYERTIKAGPKLPA